jgi:hypothetical protein
VTGAEAGPRYGYGYGYDDDGPSYRRVVQRKVVYRPVVERRVVYRPVVQRHVVYRPAPRRVIVERVIVERPIYRRPRPAWSPTMTHRVRPIAASFIATALAAATATIATKVGGPSDRPNILVDDMVKNISVTLPDENRYLLWDRTFKEQSPFVKKALRSLIQTYGSHMQSVIKDTDSGQLIYAHMGNFNRNVAKVPFDEVTRKARSIWLPPGSSLSLTDALAAISYVSDIVRALLAPVEGADNLSGLLCGGFSLRRR